MSFSIAPEVYQQRRQRLMKDVDADVIVLAANRPLQKSRDTAYPFQQDSNFLYLTGIEDPGWILVMEPKDGASWLVRPIRNKYEQHFISAAEQTQLLAAAGITQVQSNQDGWRIIKQKMAKAKKVGVQAPPHSYMSQFAMYAQPTRRNLLNKLRRGAPKRVEFNDVSPHLARQRTVKDAAELRCIERAIEVTAAGFAYVRKNLANYQYEFEIEADLTAIFRKSGLHHAYEPVVAAGNNANTLHYERNSESLQGKTGILVDAGAKAHHYAADITRCFLRQPDERYQKVHAAVLNVQAYAIGLLKPGITLREYERQVERKIGEELIALGLIQKPLHKHIRKYFPHATSHFLGLDVHDVGGYDDPLPVDAVLTVEPGIYVPEWEIGVRIEDNIRITANGCQNLSAKISKEPLVE